MKIINGIGASDYVALEKMYFVETIDYEVLPKTGFDPKEELDSFKRVQKQAINELEALYQQTLKKNKESAEIFKVHQMMLEDYDYIESVEALIEKTYSASYATYETGSKLKDFFESLDNEILNERAFDIVDVTRRMLRIFKGVKDNKELPKGKFILVSEDLYPSDIVKFDYSQIAGFVTKYGSRNGHAAILARTLNIPIVVNLGEKFDLLPEYGTLAINGLTGEVILNPNKYILDIYKEKIKEQEEQVKMLLKYKDLKAVSPKGVEVEVAVNIGSLNDLELVKKSGADGVGLFRSEFIYLESKKYPTEEEQFLIYKEVLSKLEGKKVIIRTLDIGADKKVDYFNLPKEDNPALGFRAVRICLKRLEIFKAQLRALVRASAYGRLAIMVPMITDLDQVLESKNLLKEIMEDLKKEKIPFDEHLEFGIMIETPAAAIISDILAKHVDFFSIGTNDLTQYTIAVDRTNAEVEELFDYSHEAIKRLIRLIADNAHKENIWVGICGESASELSLIDFYLEVGIDELSVSPGKVSKVKKAIIESKNG